MKRTLTVKKERVTELTTDELYSVAGAAAPPTWKPRECLEPGQTIFGCTTAHTCPRPADA